MAAMPIHLDEQTLIEEFVNQIDLPPGVEFKRIDEIIDSVGEPAYRIYFSVDVSGKYPRSKKRITALNLMTYNLSQQIFAANIQKLPLYSFLEVK